MALSITSASDQGDSSELYESQPQGTPLGTPVPTEAETLRHYSNHARSVLTFCSMMAIFDAIFSLCLTWN